jgi:hypothetical protein
MQSNLNLTMPAAVLLYLADDEGSSVDKDVQILSIFSQVRKKDCNVALKHKERTQGA